jgi:hypothetical protein
MALVLTCACGARFELDDSLAGVEVPCPDCQVPVKAPDLSTPQPRTSYWALASIVLALTGAFTVVGTLAAVACGIVALIVVLRHRKRLRGLGFAIAGVVSGLVFTVVTIFALSRGLFENWGDRMRETLLADEVDVSSNDMVVTSPDGRYSLTRPTKRWGKQLGEQTDPMLKVLDRAPPELTLVQPSRFAFVDVRTLGSDLKMTPDRKLEDLVSGYRGTASNADIQFLEGYYSQSVIRDTPQKDRELEREGSCNRRKWRIILRLCERNGTWYLVRGYVPEVRYHDVREEMTRALDSFQVKGREAQ